MESFFGRLKTECFYKREFNSREEIIDAVRDYWDYYNHRRIQLKLKGSSEVLKKGTKFKNIRLVNGDHNVDCGKIMLKSEFLKKA